MSTCPSCNSRKGKRPCQARSAPVCSQCCGTSREPTACAGCAFYKAPSRKYDSLPRFSAGEMEDSTKLQEIAFPVEAAVCSLDRQRGFKLTDAQAIEVLEVLLDLYEFGDSMEVAAARIRALDCQSVVDLVQRELQPFDRPTIAKVLATTRFVARRRAVGGRHHVAVLQSYVGSFVSPGVGLRVLADGTEVAVQGL